jgi:hypothetical protein
MQEMNISASEDALYSVAGAGELVDGDMGQREKSVILIMRLILEHDHTFTYCFEDRGVAMEFFTQL